MPSNQCPQCQSDLHTQSVESAEDRQVFELPPIKLHVTAYRAEHRFCPTCGRILCAAFTAGGPATTHYGPNMQVVMMYL